MQPKLEMCVSVLVSVVCKSWKQLALKYDLGMITAAL